MEVLRYVKVRRIVLQRSSTLVNKATWKPWFVGFYAAMINAFRPHIPIYIRVGEDDIFTAHYLSVDPVSGVVEEEVRHSDTITIGSTQCFETVWTRTECATCYPFAVSLSTAALFYESAQLIAKRGNTSLALLASNSIDTALNIRVVHAYRSAIWPRHIENIEEVRDYLSSAFSNSSFNSLASPSPYSITFLSVPTPERYDEQIPFVSAADIVITEHGAFQSSMVFMRCGSALIDLRGSYWKGDFGPTLMARDIAGAFGLNFSSVVMSKQDSHDLAIIPRNGGGNGGNRPKSARNNSFFHRWHIQQSLSFEEIVYTQLSDFPSIFLFAVVTVTSLQYMVGNN